ncbi:copper resistance system multicopper oxidase [Salinisphaera sp. SPP-AMP-43]|uniref:copper resistance system multicopper oxidase n=1 Tax=Salinisphaera sp. SPP-AMP-43 TaxID=3121288 RepID=UPI003C6E72EA
MTSKHHDPARRRLLQALGAAGLLTGTQGLWPAYARSERGAAGLNEAATRIAGGPPRDQSLDIHVRREWIDIAGGRAAAITLNHSTPGPLIELWEGHDARLRVHNHLDEPTSLHWHGLLLPFQMDGVPGVAFPGIAPGQSFEARFPVRQAGTYWYHSHSGLQEQIGQTGPIVIHPAEPEGISAEREYVLMLNDWTFEDPYRLLETLKQQSDYYNFSQRTLGDLADDIADSGLSATLRDRLDWGRMRMSPRDIADVTGHTYHYLVNGMHPAANWTGLFEPGQRIRLRVINASAMTYFNVRIPGLAMTVVAADGKRVEAVETDEFQIAVSETYDVIVEPQAERAYTVMAEAMDRSGYARGTLAPRPGMSAEVPPLRAQPQRTMVDMGMAMSGMAGNGDHAMDSDVMPSMASHESGHTAMTQKPHSMSGMTSSTGTGAVMEQAGPVIARHGPDHHGIGNLTVAEVERDRLGERGTGLEGADHRVLTYSQLRNVLPMQDRRAPAKTIEIHLTGNMERYMWSFDGVSYSDSTPIEFPYGERIRLILVNDTMMEHPIHLHGMFMELENGHNDRLPFKHTLSVLPASRVSLLITADEPGRWAFHCHLLYHMEMGMFRVVRVSDRTEADNA